MAGLVFRKLADKTNSERVIVETKQGKKLFNPATEKVEDWPLLGVMIESEILPETKIPTQTVDRAIMEGWMKRINEVPKVYPAGPPSNPFMKTHNFVECDKIVIKTVEGDVVYKVVGQPGKFADGLATRVDHFYTLELESAPERQSVIVN